MPTSTCFFSFLLLSLALRFLLQINKIKKTAPTSKVLPTAAPISTFTLLPFSLLWRPLLPGLKKNAVDVGVTDDGSIEGIVKALLVELDDVGFSISDLGVFTEVGETGDKSDANDDDNKDGNEDDDNDDEIDGSDEAVELKFQGELAL